MTNELIEMKDIIKSRRLELGLTQQELADLCHADRTTVGKWESGDIVNIKRDKLQLLSKALNISHLVLLGAEEYVPCKIDEILIYDTIYGDTFGNQITKIKNPYPDKEGQFFGIQVARYFLMVIVLLSLIKRQKLIVVILWQFPLTEMKL